MAGHIQRSEDIVVDVVMARLVAEEVGCIPVGSMGRGWKLEPPYEDFHHAIVAGPKGHVEYLRGRVSAAPSWATKS